MIKFILCLALGVIGHQTSPIFDSIERGMNGNGTAWPRIGRYAVGGLLIRASLRIMLDGERDDLAIIDGAMANALIGVGAGVSLGYVMDRYK